MVSNNVFTWMLTLDDSARRWDYTATVSSDDFTAEVLWKWFWNGGRTQKEGSRCASVLCYMVYFMTAINYLMSFYQTHQNIKCPSFHMIHNSTFQTLNIHKTPSKQKCLMLFFNEAMEKIFTFCVPLTDHFIKPKNAVCLKKYLDQHQNLKDQP